MARFKIVTPAGASFSVHGGGYAYESEALEGLDAEIVEAMKLIWKHLRVVMEPSSAVPLATVLKNRDAFAGKRVGIIITGGNVDLDKLPWI